MDWTAGQDGAAKSAGFSAIGGAVIGYLTGIVVSTGPITVPIFG